MLKLPRLRTKFLSLTAMFTGTRCLLILPTFFSAVLSGCGDFKEPEPLDPQRFFGCYGDRQNQVTITPALLRVNGTALPYEIQERRVGYVIVLPAIFVSRGGILKAVTADEHVYRLVDNYADQRIIIADQDAYVHDLPFGGCI